MVDRNQPPLLVPVATPRRRRATRRQAAVVAMRRLAVVAAASALGLIAFTSAAAAHLRGCAHAHASIHAATRSQLRRAVVCLVNRERFARHLPGLADNGRLDRSAQGWTNEMVSHRDFTHGADFASRISAVGFDWSNVGENIAAGFQTPAAVVHGWMRSTGHCQNILSPVYRMVGTGVSTGAPLTNQSGTWTQDFGLWMGQHPASVDYGPAEGCPYDS